MSHQKVRKKWGADRQIRKTAFFYLCLDSGNAVGILYNICACDLTSKLAGRNHKRHLNFPAEITLTIQTFYSSIASHINSYMADV